MFYIIIKYLQDPHTTVQEGMPASSPLLIPPPSTFSSSKSCFMLSLALETILGQAFPLLQYGQSILNSLILNVSPIFSVWPHHFPKLSLLKITRAK